MSKELSLSTPTINFEDVRRDSLYYGQFLYMTRFYLKEASALRKLNHEWITEALSMRSQWGWKHITPNVTQAAHDACDALLSISNPHKITIYSDWIYFYTNDLADIEKLTQASMIQYGQIGRAVITHNKGTIGHLNPKHKYRTYLRSHKPTQEQVTSLRQLVENSEDEIKISPGLRSWFEQTRYVWTWDHFYVDHNDMKIVTMLALINPKFVRQTKPIVRINK